MAAYLAYGVWDRGVREEPAVLSRTDGRRYRPIEGQVRFLQANPTTRSGRSGGTATPTTRNAIDLPRNMLPIDPQYQAAVRWHGSRDC